ncbi:hypothetical protein MKW92_022874 [Papaver armeniacum]|nr:hypothetical protein MKW92_022874 [Papaver armeniacum]
MREASAKMRAQEIQSTLDPSTPSLIKVMLESHVVRGFWLGVPTKFCEAFMPKVRIKMTLVDEKGFSVDHKLRIGDAVLFQLVDLLTFKVVIVKGNCVADTDGGPDIDDGLTLLQLKAQAQKRTRGDDAGKNLKRKRKPAAKHQRRVRSAGIRDENGSQQQPDDDNGDVVDPVVGDFESFTKIVSDLVGDSEIPEDVVDKYYKLCCTHNSFLHTNLHPGHNHDLVAGVITETVKIVYGIRSCKLNDTFKGELIVWRNKLEAFEKLGMSVGFIFPRLNQLQKLSENALIRRPYQRMYRELCNP